MREGVLEEFLGRVFGVVWDGARRGVERRNDGNHFWLGALGVLELGIRKTNQERRTMDGVGRGGVGRGELEI